MKKLVVLALAALMLLSCMVFVSADSPKRERITDGSTLSGWSNDSGAYDVTGIPEPALDETLDDYPVVSFTYVGEVYANGGYSKPEGVEKTNGVKIAYAVKKDETTEVESYDLTGMNYLIFDMYISDASVLENKIFWIELTSKGGPDHEERGYKKPIQELKGSALVDGWNTFELALDSHTNNTEGDLNFAAWDFIRIHNADAFDAGDGLTLAIKNMYFCEVSVTQPSTEPETPVTPPDEPATPPVEDEPVAPPTEDEPVTPPAEDTPVAPPTEDTPVAPPADDATTGSDDATTGGDATTGDDNAEPAKDGDNMTLYLIIGGAALLVVLVVIVVVVVVAKKKK